MTKQYVLNKYLPANAGRIEINVTAKTAADYEIDAVWFSVENGNTVIKEDITFYMLAMRICGPARYDDIDAWIAELLPREIAEDTFLEDADRAYEVSSWNGARHLL